jgi:hypothetical protein
MTTGVADLSTVNASYLFLATPTDSVFSVGNDNGDK